MSQLSALLSEAQVQFAPPMKKFPSTQINCIRELPNNNDFFIQPQDESSRECLMNASNLPVFLITSIKERDTLPKAKSTPSFVIVNDHPSKQENEVKEELLNNNAMNVIKVLRITSRATGKPTKLIRVITDCTNHVTAAVKNGVRIGWVLHRCKKRTTSHLTILQMSKICSFCKRLLRRIERFTVCRQTHCKKLQLIKRTGKMCKLWWLAQCIEAVLHIKEPRPKKINRNETKYSSAISRKDTQITVINHYKNYCSSC